MSNILDDPFQWAAQQPSSNITTVGIAITTDETTRNIKESSEPLDAQGPAAFRTASSSFRTFSCRDHRSPAPSLTWVVHCPEGFQPRAVKSEFLAEKANF
jgi:hypothetical protein